MDGIHQLANLGYVGVEGIDIVPHKRRPGRELPEQHKQDNLLAPASARPSNAPWHTCPGGS
jgi:hypothetical protein